jgi:hypothetical protein
MIKTYTQAWKNTALTASKTDIIIHCALKAFFARDTNSTSKEDIFRAIVAKSFTGITSPNRLANGETKYVSVRHAVWAANSFLDVAASSKKFGILGTTFEETIVMFGGHDSFNAFIRFLAQFKKLDESLDDKHYSYIFVDTTVEPIQQAVQTAHVAMVIGQNMNKKLDAKRIHYQVCKIPEGDTITSLTKRLVSQGFKVETFFESDLGKIVAVGIHPVRYGRRQKLMKFELLTF